jgi:hypothetical protein
MRFTKIIASASVAAVLGLAGVSVAGATSNPGSPTPATTTAAPAPATPKTAPKPATRGKRIALRRLVRRGAAKVIAKTIGITPAALRTELKAGKTIAAIATEHGVQPQTVITALENAATAKINAAVSAGKLKPARATRLETRIDKLVPKIVNDWHPKAAKA